MNSTPPNQVKLAVNLVWLSLGIGLLSTVFHQPATSPKFGVGFAVAVIVVTFAIIIFINFKILAGRNWARILNLILFAIGLPMSVLPLGKVFNQPTFDGLAEVLQIGLQAASLYLVFLTKGKEWFVKKKSDVCGTI
jgi:hypothetical protein